MEVGILLGLPVGSKEGSPVVGAKVTGAAVMGVRN